MAQMQVCSRGHRWDPAADRRPDPQARWNICPVCGGSVEMFSLRDSASGGGTVPAGDAGDKPTPAPPPQPWRPGAFWPAWS
jgi:hypothetical protein